MIKVCTVCTDFISGSTGLDLLKILCLCLLLPFIKGQQIPGLFLFPMNINRTVNGSSETGHCLNIDGDLCVDPISSVLFDGVIPTLTRLDGNMWASQLLTTQSSFSLGFSFHNTPMFVGVKKVEIVLFNCPEWGISVPSITLIQTGARVAGTINPIVTSCDSLVRVCIELNNILSQKMLSMTFTLNSSDWVHIAEVEFYGAGPNCPPDTTPTTDQDATSDAATEITTPEVATKTTTHSSPPAVIDGSSSASNTGAIAGGVIAVILVLIIIIFTILIIICLKKTKGKEAFAGKFQGSTLTTKDIEMPPVDHEEDKMDETGQKMPDRPNADNFPSASKTENSMISTTAVYAVVDKQKCCKPPKQPVKTAHCEEPQQPQQQSSQEQIQQMYAVVNKPKQCKPPQQKVEEEPPPSVEQMYAVVDKPKRRKPLKVSPSEQPSKHSVQQEQPLSIEQMYAVVDKPKHCKPPVQQEVPPAEQQAFNQVYSVVNKPKWHMTSNQPVQEENDEISPPEIPSKSHDFLGEL